MNVVDIALLQSISKRKARRCVGCMRPRRVKLVSLCLYQASFACLLLTIDLLQVLAVMGPAGVAPVGRSSAGSPASAPLLIHNADLHGSRTCSEQPWGSSRHIAGANVYQQACAALQCALCDAAGRLPGPGWSGASCGELRRSETECEGCSCDLLLVTCRTRTPKSDDQEAGSAGSPARAPWLVAWRILQEVIKCPVPRVKSEEPTQQVTPMESRPISSQAC